MPRRATQPADLDQLDKSGLVSFLKGNSPDKIEQWNTWRTARNFTELDLSDVSLDDLDLSGIIFCGVSLIKSTLQRTNLYKAVFSRPKKNRGLLSGYGYSDPAILRNTDLAEANLQRATLCGVDLESARLWKAELRGADLTEANLKSASLNNARLNPHLESVTRLDDADLTSADLFGSGLEAVSMNRVNLGKANLQWAFMDDCYLVGADLREANLANASLKNAHLSTANLQFADLSFARLDGADLHLCDLANSKLLGAYLDSADLGWASLTDADLRGVSVRDVNLTSVKSLTGVRLQHIRWQGMIALRYGQLFDDQKKSAIWEELQHRFYDAKEVYKKLKGFFEDVGDYEAVSWAYKKEQRMTILYHAPSYVRWFYSSWRQRDTVDLRNEDGTPQQNINFTKWVRLEIFDLVAAYGFSISRPVLWLLGIVLFFAIVYSIFGLITSMPGCGFNELARMSRDGCAPTYNLLDALVFSISTLTSTQSEFVRPYTPYVEILMSLETLLGVMFAGLLGFILGNKIRYS